MDFRGQPEILNAEDYGLSGTEPVINQECMLVHEKSGHYVKLSGTAIIDTITVSGKNLRRFFNVKFIYIVNESLHDDEFHLSKRLFPNLKSGGNKCEK